MPFLRVEPYLLQTTKNVLREGETLSNFMETSLRSEIQHRKIQQEFIARGLAAKDEAFQTGEYFSVEAVHDELLCMLNCAEKKSRE